MDDDYSDKINGRRHIWTDEVASFHYFILGRKHC